MCANKMSVCRVCLAGNLQLNPLQNKELIQLFEKLFDKKVNIVVITRVYVG